MIHLVSDLHIDDGSGPFTNSRGPEVLNSFLDMVGDNPLIGIGDILDLWAWDLSSIMLGPNAGLVKRLIGHQDAIYILGNHDLKPATVAGLFRGHQVLMSMQIGDYTIVHGHQFDPLLNSNWKRWLVEEGDRLVTELNDPTVNDIRAWFAAGDRTNKPLIEALQGTGKKYILGHSHCPVDLGWFVNSGCWISGDPHYVTIDDSGIVQLHQWKG